MESTMYLNLYAFLGDWVARELKAAELKGQRPYAAVNGLRELSESLPQFGDHYGPWQAIIDIDQERPGADFIRSNVSQFYWVNGARVQFFCAQGRVTVYPLEGPARHLAEEAFSYVGDALGHVDRIGKRGA